MLKYFGVLVLIEICFSAPHGTVWDGFKVSWGIDPQVAFNDMPRTESAAKADGWAIMSDCGTNPLFAGKRYWKHHDSSVILIYDVNGYIAGIQAGITSKDGYPDTPLINHPFILDSGVYYITAYFIPPDKVCNGGRTSTEFAAQGTGSDLYIQNGTDPVANAVRIPDTEKTAAHTLWRKGFCFPQMGVHYWYNVHADMPCSEFFPVFLLYNGGNLNGFGWAFQAKYLSQNYEHPPASGNFSLVMSPVPSCIHNLHDLTSLHIYLYSDPQSNQDCS